MKQLLGLTITLILFLTFSLGQTNLQNDTSLVFKVNYHLQPFEDTEDYQKLLNSLNGFLKTKNQSDTSNAYWLQIDFGKYKEPYEDLYHIETSITFHNLNFYKPTLLEIVRTSLKDQYVIKLAYIGPDTAGIGTINVIYNIIAVKQPDSYYKFKSALGVNTANWHTTTVGTITFIYKDKLNTEIAEKANQFSMDLAKKFQTQPISLIYYKCENPIELFRIKGYDYTKRMYMDTTGGIVGGSNTIFAANNSEWYPHEIVHFYTRKVFDHPFSRIIDEGYAAYLGGSGGKSLNELLKITNSFYKNNHQRDIINDLNIDYRINRSMSVVYPLGGLICKLAEEKMGFEGIKQLFNDEDFYKAVEHVLGVNKKNLADFLKTELDKYK